MVKIRYVEENNYYYHCAKKDVNKSVNPIRTRVATKNCVVYST